MKIKEFREILENALIEYSDENCISPVVDLIKVDKKSILVELSDEKLFLLTITDFDQINSAISGLRLAKTLDI